MKKTVEINSWRADDLIQAAAQQDSCTVEQLISFLQSLPQDNQLENKRLVCRYEPSCGTCVEARLALVGDREETETEKQRRQQQEKQTERRVLLDYLADHHRPQLRGEREDKCQQDRAVLIQQKGWDKLPVDELRLLAAVVNTL